MPLTAGQLDKRVTLERPTLTVPDGDGGVTQSWGLLSPATPWAQIKPATAGDLERVAAGTVIATATHLVTMRYHPQVTTLTRIRYRTRTFQVTGVVNPDEQNIETVAMCVEVVS